MRGKIANKLLAASLISLFILGVVSLNNFVLAETTPDPAAPTTMSCPGGSTVPTGTACPTQTHDEQCTTGGGKLCKSSSSDSNWCSYSTEPCPAYDSPSCSAEGGEWCPGSNGSVGWCAKNGATCPINDKAGCDAKGRNWCVGTSGGMGWCAMTGQTCPANDEASCTAQGSEWCTPSAGSGASMGWCSTTKGSCPVNDKATCDAKGRSWCASSSSGGTGWCAMTGSSCPNSDTNSYTCNDGTKVKSSSECPGTSNTMSWPYTETECKKYQGVWCNSSSWGGSSTMTGSCMFKGSSCPEPTPSGMTRCWDNSTATNYWSCPATPMNKVDCTAKGANWCDSSGSSYSTGYCMAKSMTCSKYAPAGQMICPDNETVTSKLTDCPLVSTVVPVVEEKTKKCSDGSMIKAEAECPKVEVYVTCADGQKVLEGKACPEKKPIPDEKITPDEKPAVKPAVEPLTSTQVKLLERQKKTLLMRIETLEKVFKRLSDQGSLTKTQALKEKLLSLPSDNAAVDTMRGIEEEVMLLQEVKDELLDKGNVESDTERDRQMQAKALAELKRQAPLYNRQILLMNSKIDKLEKAGFTISSSLKETVEQGQTIVKAIVAATTYEEVKDSVEAFGELTYEFNDWIPKLEQLQRLEKMTKSINREIVSREKNYKTVLNAVKKTKVDMSVPLSEIEATLAEVRTAFGELKTRDYSDEEPFALVQSLIIHKLEDVDDAVTQVKSILNLKASFNKLAATMKSLETRIRRLEAKKQNTEELRGLHNEAKGHMNELKAYANKKLNSDDVELIRDDLRAVYNLVDQLNDLLKLSTQSGLEKELLRVKRADEAIEKLKVIDIENKLSSAEAVSTFYRYPATDYGTTRVSGIKINRPVR